MMVQKLSRKILLPFVVPHERKINEATKCGNSLCCLIAADVYYFSDTFCPHPDLWSGWVGENSAFLHSSRPYIGFSSCVYKHGSGNPGLIPCRDSPAPCHRGRTCKWGFFSPCRCTPSRGMVTRDVCRYSWSAITCAVTCHSTADHTSLMTSISKLCVHRLQTAISSIHSLAVFMIQILILSEPRCH